ncbi:MAG TPA: Hpt domain-containing protein, partial [Terriglobales bacterium]|nr:Hpt domain-containing protein [Terriglobales bacterium]
MSYFSEDRVAEMRQLFFESAQEILQALNDEALRLEQAPSDAEIPRSIRRGVHTLKGDSAAVGFRELSQIAHDLEDALTPEVAASTPPAELVELVLHAADMFDGLLAAYRGSLPLPSVEPLRAQIAKLRSAGTVPKPAGQASAAPVVWSEYQQIAIQRAVQSGASVYRIAADLDSSCPMKAAAWQLFHNVLQRAGEVLAVQPENAAAEDVSHMEVVISSDKPREWIAGRCRIPTVIAAAKVTPWKLRAQAAEPEAPATPTAHSTAPENLLRVDAERLDQVLNLIGELIIGRSMLQQVLGEFGRRFPKDTLRHKFADAMAFQSRVLNELQRSAMQVRMVPVEQLFRRFPRLVRDVAKHCGKDVALLLSGQETELDKSILDAIGEPIAHLVRNAIDHGLESAEERQKAGKPL